MSALAAMFAPPRVRHTPNRVIVSGREIKGCGDLPPLPDAESRRALKAKIKNIQKRQWDARNPEKVKATYERWIAQNRERHNATSYQYYLSVRDTPEYKAAASERMRRWREENREQANEATKRWKAAKMRIGMSCSPFALHWTRQRRARSRLWSGMAKTATSARMI